MNRAQKRQQARNQAKADKADAKKSIAQKSGLPKQVLLQIEQQIRQEGFGVLNQERFKAEIEARMQLKKELERNGITTEDLKKNYDIGYEDGFKAGHEGATETFFAAIALALHNLYGFGAQRCHKVLTEVYNNVLYTLESADIVHEVFDKIGLVINMHADPFDPVEEVKK